MPKNDAAAAGHVCPHIRIQTGDNIHPPAIGMPPMVDIDAWCAMVAVALTANTTAVTAKKARGVAVRSGPM
jgi:hypothetical protein